MSRYLMYSLIASTMALAISTGFVRAQTGPMTEGGDPNLKLPPGFVTLTDQSLPELIRQLGFQVEAPSGSGNITHWVVRARSNGWGYLVKVVPNRVQGKITSFWLLSDLGNPIDPARPLSAQALLKLLENNHRLAPFFFTYNQESKVVCANLQLFGDNASKENLKKLFDYYFLNIRNTYNVWNTPQLYANGSQVPPAPLSDPKQNAQAVKVKKLAGTTWDGKETLDGFGNLQFFFQGDGTVKMVDAKNTVMGTFTQNGQELTLVFYNGGCQYQGTVSGTEFSGTAQAGERRWNFKVNLQTKI